MCWLVLAAGEGEGFGEREGTIREILRTMKFKGGILEFTSKHAPSGFPSSQMLWTRSLPEGTLFSF